jgi:hypothetical protein
VNTAKAVWQDATFFCPPHWYTFNHIHWKPFNQNLQSMKKDFFPVQLLALPS